MKLLPAVCVAVLLSSASIATAQQPRVPKTSSTAATTHAPARPSSTSPSLTLPTVTPELWVYAQELQRHDDPAQAVRRKAESKADQRISRLAALKWYGQSNSRPDASPIPFMSAYSPSWIGNGWERYDWSAFGIPSLSIRVENYGTPR